jgi:hypothetical protein
MSNSLLDPGQIVKKAFDETNEAHQVKAIAGGLVTEPYDYIATTYVAAGNGAGQIETVTYKSGGAGGTTVATLTLAYDGSDRLTSVTKS